jgi:hypothetical protein
MISTYFPRHSSTPLLRLQMTLVTIHLQRQQTKRQHYVNSFESFPFLSVHVCLSVSDIAGGGANSLSAKHDGSPVGIDRPCKPSPHRTAKSPCRMTLDSIRHLPYLYNHLLYLNSFGARIHATEGQQDGPSVPNHHGKLAEANVLLPDIKKIIRDIAHSKHQHIWRCEA